MPRPLRAVIALAATAVLLTGCVKIDMALTVNDAEDTVDGSIIFAIDKQVLAISGKSPEESFKDFQKGADTGLPEGTETKVYEDNRFYGTRIIYDDVPFATLNAADDGPRLVHENGRYVFTMDADMSDSSGLPQGGEALLRGMEFTVSVTFPGDVIEHDAKATVAGRTVTWRLDAEGDNQLRAVAEEPATIPWLVLSIAAGVIGLLLVAGVIVVALRLHRRREPALVAIPGADDPTLPVTPATWSSPSSGTADAAPTAPLASTPSTPSSAPAARSVRDVTQADPWQPQTAGPDDPTRPAQ